MDFWLTNTSLLMMFSPLGFVWRAALCTANASAAVAYSTRHADVDPTHFLILRKSGRAGESQVAVRSNEAGLDALFARPIHGSFRRRSRALLAVFLVSLPAAL